MKEKREKKLNYSLIVATVLLLSLFIIGTYSKEKYEEEIKTYSGSAIGLANSFKNYSKTKDLNYYFYLDGKRIISKTSGNGFTNRKLKKFYLIKYDITNPTKNHIYLSIKIDADSLKLVKAGFKYLKYREYDIATNTYIERYKWQ